MRARSTKTLLLTAALREGDLRLYQRMGEAQPFTVEWKGEVTRATTWEDGKELFDAKWKELRELQTTGDRR